MDQRDTQGFIERFRGRMIRLSSLSKQERADATADVWLAISSELNSAYADQVAGMIDFRMTIDDVSISRCVAQWARYHADMLRWNSDIRNTTAEDLVRKSDPTAESDEVKARMAARPQPPGKIEPKPSDFPQDWPPMMWEWDLWCAELWKRRNPRKPRLSVVRDDAGVDAQRGTPHDR